MQELFEPVLQVTQYLDGPRKGSALLHGKPHAFSSRFHSSDLFDLVPLGTPVGMMPVLASAQFRPAPPQAGQHPDELSPLEVCWRVFVQVSV